MDRAAPLLEVSGLRVDIARPDGTLHAVDNVGFTLGRGEALGIVGESGSGKSMTALAIMGLLPPRARRSAATLRLAGRDLLVMPDAEFASRVSGKTVAMVFQEPMTSLNPVYPVGRQLTEAMPHASRAEAAERALFLLDKVGITAAASRMSQYPHQLSGGQRQRVMIAMALMNSPELVIADEPTTALDVTIQAQILRLLAGLQRELGMALILITHDLGVASRTVDRIAVMHAGRVVESGDTADVLGSPKDEYTQGLLASVPKAMREGAGSRLAMPAPAAAVAARAAPPLLAAEDVRCTFRVRRGIFARTRELHAVDGVSLELVHGDALALVGESGCGKSTLARMLLGLQPATSGRVLLDGRPIGSIPSRERARRVQAVFQDPYGSLNPRRTVGEIVRRPLDVHGIGDPAKRRGVVADLLQRVGLPPDIAARYPGQASGGQRQRIAIARALVMRPEVLVCDEPTSALDVTVQSQILALLEELRAQMGLTFLVITHDIGVVERLATRVAVMYYGQIVEIGAKDAIFRNPRHPYTRILLDSVLTLRPGAGIPDTALGSAMPDPLEIPAGCRFHPRCPMAIGRCARERPGLGANGVRCLLVEDSR